MNQNEWRDRCPKCGSVTIHLRRGNGRPYYKCRRCSEKFDEPEDIKGNVDYSAITKARDWAGAVAMWLQEQGKQSFKHAELPEFLKRWNLFQRAAMAGYIRSVEIDSHGHKVWVIV